MSTVIAIVDMDQVSLADDYPQVDFINESDIWARMAFQSRQQINRLRHKKSLRFNRTTQSLHSLQYSFREE